MLLGGKSKGHANQRNTAQQANQKRHVSHTNKANNKESPVSNANEFQRTLNLVNILSNRKNTYRGRRHKSVIKQWRQLVESIT